MSGTEGFGSLLGEEWAVPLIYGLFAGLWLTVPCVVGVCYLVSYSAGSAPTCRR